MKLVDAVVPPADLVKAAKDWIKAGGKPEAPWDEEGFRLPGGPVYSKAGMMTFPPANAIYRRETYDNYPAARAILQMRLRGPAAAIDTALRVELRWFAKILRSPEAAGDDPLAVRLHAGAQQGRAPSGRRAADAASRRSASSAPASWAPASPRSARAAGIEVVLIDRDQETADKGKAACTRR